MSGEGLNIDGKIIFSLVLSKNEMNAEWNCSSSIVTQAKVGFVKKKFEGSLFLAFLILILP